MLFIEDMHHVICQSDLPNMADLSRMNEGAMGHNRMNLKCLHFKVLLYAGNKLLDKQLMS